MDFLLIGYIKLFAIFFFTYRNAVCKWVVVTRVWLSAPAQEKEKHNADKDCDVDCAPRKLFHKNKTARRIMPAVERKKPTAGPVSRRHTSFPIWPVKLPHDGFFKLHWACHSCLMLVARGRAFLFNCSPTVAPNYFYATLSATLLTVLDRHAVNSHWIQRLQYRRSRQVSFLVFL